MNDESSNLQKFSIWPASFIWISVVGIALVVQLGRMVLHDWSGLTCLPSVR